MSTRITRRRLITTAVTAAAGVSGVGGAASIANRYGSFHLITRVYMVSAKH